jgi:hypothetical protein
VRELLEKILAKYGTTLLLCRNGNDVAFRGFLHSRKSVSQRNGMKKISPLGEIPGDTYLLIGPADCGAKAGDEVVQGSNYYELRQVEKVIFKNNPIYLWGLCVQKGGADTWDS